MKKKLRLTRKITTIISLFMIFTLVLAGCSRDENKGQEVSTGKTEGTSNDVGKNTANTDSDTKVQETASGENGSEEELEEGVIKILYGSGLCGIPLHIAKQLEFFEAEGLAEGVDYEYVTSSTSGVEMLSTKQADVSFGLVAAMLAPLDNGLEAKTVLGIHTGCIQILAGNNSGVKSVEELKGKRIGVEQLASSPHIVAQRVLAGAGIGTTADNMEVEFVVFPKDDLPVALKEGKVDAIAIGDPKANILANDGSGVSIFNSATSDLLKDEYCCALWVRNETIDKMPKKLAKVVTAIQKSSVWVAHNTDLAAQIQLDNEWLVGDLALDQQTLGTYHYLPSVSGVEEALTRNILDMKELGLIREDTDAGQLAKTSFFRLEGVEDEITETIEAPIDPASQVKK